MMMVQVVVSLGLVAGIWLSWPLWHSVERSYPVLPFAGYPKLRTGMELGLIILGGATLAAGIWRSGLLWLAVLALGILVLGDQTRLQPWVYQYGLMLWVLGCSRESPIGQEGLRIVIIAIYFWAGYHKLAPSFESVWKENFAAPLLATLEGKSQESVANLYRYVPYIEMATGLLLLFSKTRIVGVAMGCLMHLGILAMLGPIGPYGNSTNVVIWPWNIVMILLLIFLFAPKRRATPEEAWKVSWWIPRAVVILVAALVLVMPMRNASGKWDNYPSFHLYSGVGERFIMIVMPQGEKKIPEAAKKHWIKEPRKLAELHARDWCYAELKVPAVVDDRVMLDWCQSFLDLEMTNRDGFIHRDGHRDERKIATQIRLNELKNMKFLKELETTKD